VKRRRYQVTEGASESDIPINAALTLMLSPLLPDALLACLYKRICSGEAKSIVASRLPLMATSRKSVQILFCLADVNGHDFGELLFGDRLAVFHHFSLLLLTFVVSKQSQDSACRENRALLFLS